MPSNLPALRKNPHIPSSENYCAVKMKYEYTNKNIMTCMERKIQKDDIVNKFVKTGLIHADAHCVDVDDVKTGRTTEFDKNPFDFATWALSNRTQLRLKDEKHVSHYATAPIYAGEFVAHVCGKIEVTDPCLSGKQNLYKFPLGEVNFSVNCCETGNSSRLLRHSCDPNCSIHVFIHKFEYKIVIKAKSDISFGQELTIGYNWKFNSLKTAVVCDCESVACTYFIGKYVGDDKQIKSLIAKHQLESKQKKMADMKKSISIAAQASFDSVDKPQFIHNDAAVQPSNTNFPPISKMKGNLEGNCKTVNLLRF